MKLKLISMALTPILIMLIFLTTAYANSSWIWLTNSPLVVLPYAIIFTLAFETISIIIFGKVNRPLRVLIVVTLSNLCSFILPYILRSLSLVPTSGDSALLDAFIGGPNYIVLFGYLFLTLVIELPVTEILLENHTSNKKRLRYSIIVSNIITTLAVAICERIVCIGQW